MLRRFSTRFFLLAFLVAAVALSGCDVFQDDDDGGSGPGVAKGVIVGSAGNFSDQNGTLTIYDPQTNRAETLGSLNALFQTMTLHESRLYTVINNDDNSGRIDVLDADGGSYERLGQVLFARPPLAIAFAGGDRAYVTAQKLAPDYAALPSVAYALTLDPLAITDTVAVGPQPVAAVAAEGKVFTANYGTLGAGHTLSVIEAGTGEARPPIDLGCTGPNALFEDDEDEVVVVCQGREQGQVLFVDAPSGTVTRRLDGFGVALGAADYSDESEELFVAGGEQVFRIDTDANARAGTIAVPADDALTGLGAIAYDPVDRRLYLARNDAAAPYKAAGTVVIMQRTDGQTFEKRGAFVAGITPVGIVFNR